MDKVEIGKISHFFSKISVAIVELSKGLNVGDTISIEGHGNVFTQKVDSMQIEHKNVPSAKKGQSIGLKVGGVAKEGDVVYKVTA